MNGAKLKHPVVTKDDDGIRPAGKPDECFYCGAKIGQNHKLDCVTIARNVVVEYSFMLTVDVPQTWDKDAIESHRNEGTWCANNALTELLNLSEEKGCLCGTMKCSYIGEEE